MRRSRLVLSCILVALAACSQAVTAPSGSTDVANGANDASVEAHAEDDAATSVAPQRDASEGDAGDATLVASDAGTLDGGAAEGAVDAPADVYVPSDPTIVELAGGRDFMCALRKDGELWCWGTNQWGALGQGALDTDPHPTPMQVPIPRARKVVTGGRHVCVITWSDEVYCWGWNAFGQLGHDKALDTPCTTTAGYTCSPTPMKVPGLTEVVELTAAFSNTCAVRGPAGGRSVLCWGANYSGELGHSPSLDPVCAINTRCSFTPSPVEPQVDAGAAPGDFSDLGAFYVKSGGKWLAWGANRNAELGSGTADTAEHTQMVAATLVPASASMKTRGANGQRCYVSAGSTVSCWGANSVQRAGFVYDASQSVLTKPGDLGLTGAVDVALSGESGCALHANGGVTCWGNNASGQCGHDPQTDPNTIFGRASLPVAMAKGPPYTALGHGDILMCGLKADNTVWCWGSNQRGALGAASSVTSSFLPLLVSGVGSAAADAGAVDAGPSDSGATNDAAGGG